MPENDFHQRYPQKTGRYDNIMLIDVTNLDYRELNDRLRQDCRDFTLAGCCGQRFIAAGMSGKDITIEGVPGNALGAYLNGASITVRANAQDAVGDTMNEGKIVVCGSIGDAAGYAMRGGAHFRERKCRIPCRHSHESLRRKNAGHGNRRSGGEFSR